MSPADVAPDCSTLLFTRLATLDGTPGGTRTPNLRFWRPLLCQLSYWRIFELCRFRKRQWRLAPPLPGPAISGERGSGDSLRGGGSATPRCARDDDPAVRAGRTGRHIT